MSTLTTTLQARLTKVQARIAEIEAKYPGILRTKSYSASTATGPSKTNQDFKAVHEAYLQLLSEEEELSLRIDAAQSSGNTSSYVASTRRPS